MNPIQYFQKALSLFHDLPSFHTDRLNLANRVVHLRTPSMDLRNRLLPSLAHLIDDSQISSPEMVIWYAQEKDLPQKLKAPPWNGFNGQGYSDLISQDDVQLFFQPWQRQVFMYSRSKRTGIYWVRKTGEVPWWESTFSFRILFHMWTQDLPAQLVHAGAMAKNGTGVLITGKSGAGKSTSCLNLLRAGYNYLGDDYVWIELGKPVEVFSLYQTAKIEPDNLQERFSDWKPFIKNKQQYKKQKAIFDIKDLFPKAGITSSIIKAILLPHVAGGDISFFEKASAMHSLMAMAPTTLHHLPHNRESSYQKLVSVTSSLPSYHWHLGRDKGQFIASFNEFLKNEFTDN